LRAVALEAARHLEWLKDAGVREVPVPGAGSAGAAATASGTRRGPVPPAGVSPGPVEPAVARPAAASGPGGTPAHAPSEKGCGSPALLAVRQDLGDCRRCKLAGGRTTLVFGVGAPDAELMFVGEGPGAEEDQRGEPFVGKAGQLLTRMIEAMGFRRDEVHIANVVKCRPPGNRNPEPDEIEACEPFLRRQIEAIRPKVIVALGKFAAQTLLHSTIPITKLRGSWSSYRGVRLMPTFHPAYLLRSPEEKKKAWADLQLVMAELGKVPPTR
jgi:DNA polymerase